MSVVEFLDPAYVRDRLSSILSKLELATTQLMRFATTGVSLMDETAKAVRARTWGGYLDYISYVYYASYLTSEDRFERKSLEIHIMRPLLYELRRLNSILDSLSKYTRWGIGAEPFWLYGSEVTAPPANTALVSKTVTTGKTGYVFGIFILAGEANDFKLNWTENGSAKSIRILFPSMGALYFYDFKEMCRADEGTTVSITNVNAGGAGVVYQAGLLIAEV